MRTREREIRVVAPLLMFLLLIGLCMSVGYIGDGNGVMENRPVTEPSAAQSVRSSDGEFPTVSGNPLFTLHILAAQESQIAIERANWISSNLQEIGIEGIVHVMPWPYWTIGVNYRDVYGLERPGPSGPPEWFEVSHQPHFHHAISDGSGVMYCAGYQSEYDHWSFMSTPPGYGNLWEDWLTKSFYMPPGPVTLSYSIQYDTEPIYDYIEVLISADGEKWVTLASLDGASIGFETQSLDLSSYSYQDVELRFRFHSDGWNSDQDGSLDTDGACRIDWVEITSDGQPVFRDDFETGDDDWNAYTPPQPAIQGFDIAVMGLASEGYMPRFELGTPDSDSCHGYSNPTFNSLVAELLALGIDWNADYPSPPDLSDPVGQEAIDIMGELQHIWVEDQPFWVLWGRDNFDAGSTRTGWSVAASNLANPNIAQQAVRQAISLSIDRQGMVDAGLEVAPSIWDVQTPILPFIPGYDDVSESTPYSYSSVIKARQLLYDAGYTDIIIPDSDMDGWDDYDELFFIFSDPFEPGPFYIDGDDQLAAMAAWHAWEGDGSEDWPYVIESYNIDVNDADVSCIDIQNIVNKHFIVRDCTLTGATAPNYNMEPPYSIMRAGISLYNVHGAELTNNLCFGNLEGISLNLSTNCLVSDNDCYGDILDGIMVCVYSNQNEIVNNYCHDNGWDGIIVAWGSEENTVAGNNCSLNGRSGITLVGWYAVYGGACNNDVIENNCTGNGSWGIAVRYWSDDNVVESNLCKNNGYGIYTVLASSNTFFHNLILYNDLQVYDEYSESGNYWYSPALLEGNVWSDYIGVDFDHDGIGDTDVPWPEEGFDPYPLVTGDFDNDGLSYYAEIIIGTDPENPDSDFDGFSDADEWRLYFTEPLTPNEPQDATEVIVADIQDLVDSGDLKQGTANSMLKKIEGAVVLMERGNYHAASQKLGDFIDQVSALVVSGRLSAEEGEALIELAQGIVNVLNAT